MFLYQLNELGLAENEQIIASQFIVDDTVENELMQWPHHHLIFTILYLV